MKTRAPPSPSVEPASLQIPHPADQDPIPIDFNQYILQSLIKITLLIRQMIAWYHSVARNDIPVL